MIIAKYTENYLKIVEEVSPDDTLLLLEDYDRSYIQSLEIIIDGKELDVEALIDVLKFR